MPAWANGIHQVTTQSPESVIYLSRNASTDIDAVYFNPAGTAFMKEGMHLYLADQALYMPVSLTATDVVKTNTKRDYEGKQFAPSIPSLFAAYNRELGSGHLALSGAFLMFGGGGAGKFDEGIQMFDVMAYHPMMQGTPSSKFSATRFFLGPQFNAAYTFLDERLAVALGYRFIYGYGTDHLELYSNGALLTPGGEYDSTRTGQAHGFVLSLAARPLSELTLALRGEYHTQLNMTADATGDERVKGVDPSFADGGVIKMQFPANINLGAAYQWGSTALTFSASYYLNRLARWGRLNDAERTKIASQYDNGYEVSLSVAERLASAPFTVGGGYHYNVAGATTETRSQLADFPNYHSVGLGGTYHYSDDLTITLGGNAAYFVPVDVNKYPRETAISQNVAASIGTAKFSKVGYSIALGVGYTF